MRVISRQAVSTVKRIVAKVPSSRKVGLVGSTCLNKRRVSNFQVKAMSGAEDWVSQDKRRMLHAVYRVGDMDTYIKYMQDCFGMKLLRYRDIKEDKYTNAFLGYGSELTNFALEYVSIA